MLFSLPNNTECVLKTFVGRTQNSGHDDVPAVTFRLKLASVPNALLDLFSPTIRHTVYRAVEGQDQLPGMEDTTPILQSKDLTEWAPDTCLEGWRVIVARGISDDSGLQMGSCKVDDFRFSFFDGGHMDVDFRISTADVDEAGAGMLWGRQKRKVFVMITAPEAQASSGTVIDGTKGHPGLAASKEAAAASQGDLLADGAAGDAAAAGDATAEFERQHGNGERHAGDFGAADDASDDTGAPGAGDSDDAGTAERGENWPFPQGDGAEADAAASDEPQWPAGTDAGAGDAAEFEAGAKAALEKAGVAPRGRRGRKTAGAME